MMAPMITTCNVKAVRRRTRTECSFCFNDILVGREEMQGWREVLGDPPTSILCVSMGGERRGSVVIFQCNTQEGVEKFTDRKST